MSDPEPPPPAAEPPATGAPDTAKPKEESGCMKGLGCFGRVADFMSCFSVVALFVIGVGFGVWHIV